MLTVSPRQAQWIVSSTRLVRAPIPTLIASHCSTMETISRPERRFCIDRPCPAQRPSAGNATNEMKPPEQQSPSLELHHSVIHLSAMPLLVRLSKFAECTVTHLLVRSLYKTRCPHSLQRIASPRPRITF